MNRLRNGLLAILVGTIAVTLAATGQAQAEAITAGSDSRSGHNHGHSHELANQEAKIEDPSPQPSMKKPTTVLRAPKASSTSRAASIYSRSKVDQGPRLHRPVHLHQLPDGERFQACAGSGNSPTLNAKQSYTCQEYNWATGELVTVNTDVDRFCGAAVFDKNGNLIFAGGNAFMGYPSQNKQKQWMGIKTTSKYNPWTGQTKNIGDMHEARWYPNLFRNTFTEQIYVMGGLHNGKFSSKWEVMDDGTESWRLLPWTLKDFSYDDYKMVDASHAFYSGVSTTTNNPLRPFIQNLQTGARKGVPGLRDPKLRNAGAAVTTYPAQAKKTVVFGGGTAGKARATNKVDIVDLSAPSPRFRAGANMPAGVMFVVASNLPNGQVMVTGGTKYWRTGSVLWAGVYSPWSNKWDVLTNPPKIARNYHTNGYTRGDGAVFVAGGNPKSGSFESRTEVIYPWYTFSTRPVIGTYTKEVTRGQSYDVAVDMKGTKFGYVTLNPPRATTHSASDTSGGIYNLPAISTADGVKVTVPAGDIIPEGWYQMSVVTDKRVPSEAKWVHVMR